MRRDSEMTARGTSVSLSVLRQASSTALSAGATPSACFGSDPGQRARVRRRIWEVIDASHCSIIGTCLTLPELRRLARRIGCSTEARYSDYEVHGMFVERMGHENAVSRATQKFLDAKFESAIRKAGSLSAADDFHAYWEAAVDNGFVPGAYWALITHARLPSAVEARIYGDVHMMSHICGASHRSDARALAEARREKADVARRLTAIISGRNEDLRRQQTEIDRLTKQVSHEAGAFGGGERESSASDGIGQTTREACRSCR